MYLTISLIYRYMISNDESFKQVVVDTMTSSMLLIIFLALKRSSFGGEFLAQHDTIVMLSLCVLALVFHKTLLITLQHRSNNINNNNDIFEIICSLLVSIVTSIVEVWVVSHTAAAIITFILSCITLSWFVVFNGEVVFNWEEIATKNVTKTSKEYNNCFALVAVLLYYTFLILLIV